MYTIESMHVTGHSLGKSRILENFRRNARKTSNKAAFTLIELSIVLVIIGLLVGGVLVGTELVRASYIRAQITQIEKYNQAVLTFRDKYNCLPGDCSNATDFFGIDPVGCAATDTTPRTSGTCNGDGDDTISGRACDFNDYDGSDPCREGWRFFQMLWLAKLAPDGPFASGNSWAGDIPSSNNVPKSPLRSTTGIAMHWYNDTNTIITVTADVILYRHSWSIGSGSSHAPLWSPGATAREASNLDFKLDDGNANTGRVRSFSTSGSGLCRTYSTGIYTTTDNRIYCAVFWLAPF